MLCLQISTKFVGGEQGPRNFHNWNFLCLVAFGRGLMHVLGLLYCADVARDAADIVLMDDEFPSIVNAIEEGRVIYDNLKKTIAYTLAHAAPEVFPLFLNLVLNFPLGE